MPRQHLVSMSTWLMPIALCLGVGPAAAQRANQPTIRIVSAPGQTGAKRQFGTALSPYFKALQASFAEAYPTVSVNADFSDLWPCVGGSSPNPDCPTVGQSRRHLASQCARYRLSRLRLCAAKYPEHRQRRGL